jgi:hypothetical protein
LTAGDIALDAGSTGTTKGNLTRTGTGVYELGVSGITAAGSVTVSVTKSGYNISGGPKQIAVAKAAMGTLPESGITIQLWMNEDDGQILDSNEAVAISKSGAVKSFTATVTGAYTGVQWYLNGGSVSGSRGRAQSITVNAAAYDPGTYRLGVTVTKGAVPYSTEITFTVTN